MGAFVSRRGGPVWRRKVVEGWEMWLYGTDSADGYGRWRRTKTRDEGEWMYKAKLDDMSVMDRQYRAHTAGDKDERRGRVVGCGGVGAVCNAAMKRGRASGWEEGRRNAGTGVLWESRSGLCWGRAGLSENDGKLQNSSTGGGHRCGQGSKISAGSRLVRGSAGGGRARRARRTSERLGRGEGRGLPQPDLGARTGGGAVK